MIESDRTIEAALQQGNQRTGRQVPCPNCGGPIEFKMGAAAALVCPWCRFGVVRRGVALEAIGKMADLVPTSPIMSVGTRGTLKGERFVVGGRLQLDHGRGPWDEWYIEFPERRRWAWLAFAQGVWYLTFPVEGIQEPLPSWEAMEPGLRGYLPGTGNREWTVGERGESTLVSAEGELPFPPPPPGTRGRYVDLHGPEGAFATIDYGDGSEPPLLFVGERLRHEQVSFESGGAPHATERGRAGRLRCPNCGAPVDVRVPEDTQHAVCQHCNGLLDYRRGELHYLQRLEQARAQALIPLGATGTLFGLQCLCIGMMERSVTFDGVEYAWQEYLLHTPHGYRWLLQDNGHWVWVEPVDATEISFVGPRPVYRNVSYAPFQGARSRVRFVVGEFYWQVKLGDTTQVEDFIAPPRVLSHERTEREQTWSLGTYLEPRVVWNAFRLPGNPPPRQGVHPAQPNPARPKMAAAVGAFVVVLLFVIQVIAHVLTPSPRTLIAPAPNETSGNLAVPPLPDPDMQRLGLERSNPPRPREERGAEPNPLRPDWAFSSSPSSAEQPRQITAERFDPRHAAVSVTPPFDIRKRENVLEVELKGSNLHHAWLGVAVALVRIPDGETREFTMEVSRWQGVGGVDTSSTRLDGVPAGRYRLRAETRWAAAPERVFQRPPFASLKLSTHPTSGPGVIGFFCFLLLAFLPFLYEAIRSAAFEKRRWAESSTSAVSSNGGMSTWGDSSCGSDCGGGCGDCGSDCGD